MFLILLLFHVWFMLLCIYPMDCWFLAFLSMHIISLWTFLCSLFFILRTLLSFIVINCAIWSTEHKVVINLSWDELSWDNISKWSIIEPYFHRIHWDLHIKNFMHFIPLTVYGWLHELRTIPVKRALIFHAYLFYFQFFFTNFRPWLCAERR